MTIVTHFHLLTWLAFGLAWLGLAVYLRRRTRKRLTYLLFFGVFSAYLFAVLDVTVLQYQSLLLLKRLAPHLMLNGQDAGTSVNLIPLVTLGAADLKTSLLNVLMLVPFGFGLPFITAYRMGQTVVRGACFSVLIEALQFTTGLLAGMTFRVADVNDVLFNTLGAAAGYAAFAGFLQLYRHVLRLRPVPSNPVLRYVAERPQTFGGEGPAGAWPSAH